MKHIYLVRHAESEGNIGLHFQGHHTSLTEKGRTQAQHVARRASSLDIQALIASPMVRAYDTAQAIAAETGLSIDVCEHFAERRRPSRIIGTAMTDAEATALNDAWTESLFVGGTRVEDAENYDDLVVRSRDALAYLADHPAESMLVVSHGFFLCFLLARMIAGESITPALVRNVFNTFHTSNTGISLVRHGGPWTEWEVIAWNDHAHLGELRRHDQGVQ